MPITHTNAKGKTYYLHQGTTKTGKLTYHFSMQSNGALAESIPEAHVQGVRLNHTIFARDERQLWKEPTLSYDAVRRTL